VVERSPEKAGVGGSTPSRGTTYRLFSLTSKTPSGHALGAMKFCRRWYLPQLSARRVGPESENPKVKGERIALLEWVGWRRRISIIDKMPPSPHSC
jgi:hypothetical protein